jgi:hypothetical protein
MTFGPALWTISFFPKQADTGGIMSEKRPAVLYRGGFVAVCGVLSVVIAAMTDRILIGLIFGVPLTLAGAWLAWIGWRASEHQR